MVGNVTTYFATLSALFLPYMVPFSVTLTEACQSCLFRGARIVVLPTNPIKIPMVDRVFKGKVAVKKGYD